MTICAGCDASYEGFAAFCPHCVEHSLCDAGKSRALFGVRLMAITPAQRNWLNGVVEMLEAEELCRIIERLAEQADPIERSRLFAIVAAVGKVLPFADGKPRCRR
jgi:hypothetical protein